MLNRGNRLEEMYRSSAFFHHDGFDAERTGRKMKEETSKTKRRPTQDLQTEEESPFSTADLLTVIKG